MDVQQRDLNKFTASESRRKVQPVAAVQKVEIDRPIRAGILLGFGFAISSLIVAAVVWFLAAVMVGVTLG